MKLFQFTSRTLIHAESEAEAKDVFADNSWDFAADAEIEEIVDPAVSTLLWTKTITD